MGRKLLITKEPRVEIGNKIIDSCLSGRLWERLRKNLAILKFALYWNIAFHRACVALPIAKWWNTTDDSYRKNNTRQKTNKVACKQSKEKVVM